MKTTMTILKAGLVGLFLMGLMSIVSAQSIDKTPDGAPVQVGPETDTTNTGRINTFSTDRISATGEGINSVLFYNPGTSGPSFTLTASRTEDLSVITPAPTRDPDQFTHYRWFYLGQDGAGEVDGTAFNTNLGSTGLLQQWAGTGDNQITLTELSEGYHYFKVKGIVNPNNIAEEELCESQEETFVVYVLPQLAVSPITTSTLNDGTGTSIFQYCVIEAVPSDPTLGQQKVSITTDYNFVNSAITPAVDGFEVKYRWYAVKQSAEGSYPDVSIAANDPEDINDVFLLETSTSNATGGSLPIFFPQMDEIGTYKILVEVEYAVKDRNYDDADVTTRVRDYVIYRSLATLADGTTEVEITVTPQPGKPHITIEDVTD